MGIQESSGLRGPFGPLSFQALLPLLECPYDAKLAVYMYIYVCRSAPHPVYKCFTVLRASQVRQGVRPVSRCSSTGRDAIDEDLLFLLMYVYTPYIHASVSLIREKGK